MMYLKAVIIAVLASGFVPTSSSYKDILQELQTLLQPFQLSTESNIYHDGTTRKPSTRKHADRLFGEAGIWNNPINNFNLFSTTVKPIKKSTRHNSSQYQPTTRRPNKQPGTARQPWQDDKYNTQSTNYNTNKTNRGTNETNNRRPTNNNNNEATTESHNKPNNFVNIKPNDRRPTNNTQNKPHRDLKNDNPASRDPNRPTSNRNVNVTGIATITNVKVTTWPNTKEHLSTNGKQRPNYDTFTTKSPYLTRPGVKPAPVDENLPPITNRPVSNGGGLRPPDTGSYTEGPITTATIEIGPDEDDMTPAERSRYLDLAESMCDNYKALSVKEVVALPLVPSPEGVAFNVSQCTPLNIALIIGGKVSNIEEFPHMALVGWKKIRQNGYSWKCGGSLVSDQYILTAGHCTYHEKDYDVVSGPPHVVQLGSSLVENPNALVVKIASVVRHPKYKQRRSYFDVALIKMATRVTFTEAIRPACLGVPPSTGKPIIATGWGRTEFGGDQSNELRSVSLPIWDMQDCRRIWGTSLKLPNGPTVESHVCAGEKSGGKDTCQGDSGGPAQVQDGCTWRVVAVTSYGRSCGAPHTPALYATVPRAFVAAQVFGKHRTMNNPKRQNENLQLNNGYGSQQYQSASQQQNNIYFEDQQQYNNRFESQQQNNNRFESQQQNNNRFEDEQQNVNKYSNQQPISVYRRPQSSDNSYTSSLYTSDLNDNEELTINKFGNPQTTSRYNNQQQNENKYIKQQTSNIYEPNPNIYQQLSNTGGRYQIGEWNKQNGNIGDGVPTGGSAATNDRVQGDFIADSWNYPGQSNQYGNYFTTTAIPWWNGQ